MKKIKFKECDINDPFFDSFKEDYENYEEWFNRKGEDDVYVWNDNGIQALLKLKPEYNEDYPDIYGQIDGENILKISAFKTNLHNTKELFDIILKEFDGYDSMYVTMNNKPKLKEIFEQYGFDTIGKKNTEDVLLRCKCSLRNDNWSLYLDETDYHHYAELNDDYGNFILDVSWYGGCDFSYDYLGGLKQEEVIKSLQKAINYESRFN